MNDQNTDNGLVDDVSGAIDWLFSGTRADVKTMQKEQIEDDTLKGWWSLAKRVKGGFFVKDGLLYHAEKIVGQSFSQFCRKLHCVPKK